MNLDRAKAIKTTILFLIISVAFIYTGCRRRDVEKRQLISFKSLNGIDYTEVRRYMKNGLSFNEYGYQLEPQWKLRFVSDDSVSVYSPIKNKFLNFPLSRGYDSIFNAARAWFKVRKMNKDSLVFEILKFQNDSIDISGAKVLMKFYANDYIKNTLHSDSTILRRPSRKDSLFIKKLADQANRNPAKAFAAREPAQLIPKSPLASIEARRTKPDMMNNFDTSDDYLDPEYFITIKKAYQDFYYSFTIIVDYKGGMHYGKPLVAFQDQSFAKDYIHTSQAVLNSYLNYYFNVVPGTTLGIPHTSIVSVHVKGIAGNK